MQFKKKYYKNLKKKKKIIYNIKIDFSPKNKIKNSRKY